MIDCVSDIKLTLMVQLHLVLHDSKVSQLATTNVHSPSPITIFESHQYRFIISLYTEESTIIIVVKQFILCQLQVICPLEPLLVKCCLVEIDQSHNHIALYFMLEKNHVLCCRHTCSHPRTHRSMMGLPCSCVTMSFCSRRTYCCE